MLGMLTVSFPKKAVALALAAIVLTTTLVVAPVSVSVPVVRDVPVIGDLIAGGPSASAHVQQECITYTTYVYPTYQSMQHGAQPVPTTVTRCYSVAHTHQSSWKPWVLGGIGLLGCGAIGVGNAAAGYLCGAQVLVATGLSGN